jgi:hypothetical protein
MVFSLPFEEIIQVASMPIDPLSAPCICKWRIIIDLLTVAPAVANKQREKCHILVVGGVMCAIDASKLRPRISPSTCAGTSFAL